MSSLVFVRTKMKLPDKTSRARLQENEISLVITRITVFIESFQLSDNTILKFPQTAQVF